MERVFKILKNKLKNKIVIVAGGSGQIGQNTVQILLSHGAKVINLDFINKNVVLNSESLFKIKKIQKKIEYFNGY